LNVRLALTLPLIATLAACGPKYSPDTYATSAVQQANKVEQGTIIGVREVLVASSGAVGGVTGAAAGGLAGSQMGTGPASAFGALGGSLVGGLAGAAAEQIAADTKAYEYIVRKANDELVSVTQKDATPLPLHTKVLVIAGTQARVVPDYTSSGQAAAPEVKPKPQVTAIPLAPPPSPTQPASEKPVEQTAEHPGAQAIRDAGM
jgi:outer membrane lipoprotein SlyB